MADNTKERFTMHRLWKKGWWRCKDNEHGLFMDWQEHHFNDIQEAGMSKEAHAEIEKTEKQPEQAIATWLREMAEWLRTNHAEKVF